MEREDDDPILRITRFNQYLGIVNPYSFQRHLDDAIKDAAAAGRADTFAVRPWIAMGPRNIGGRVGALAQDPINPSILYAGSGLGGVWKTVDAGDTWTPLDNFTPPAGIRQALPIGAIAVARSNPQIVYVGTGEPTLGSGGNDFDVPGFGLYRSTDGGGTFTQIDDIDGGTIQASRYERILVDPWDADRCWIASLKGLWRREAGGGFTQDVIGGGAPPAATQNVTDVVIDFGDVTAGAPATFTVYVGVYGSGIYRATFDRATKAYTGATPWTKLATGIDESGFAKVKIALCATQPNVLYCVFGEADMAASRVYRSADRGATWEKTSKRPDDSGHQANYDLFIEVHPKRPEVAFTGSVEVWRTQNSGEKWEKVLDWTNYDGGDRAQHADQHAFLFDAGRDGTIWLCNDGGISRSRNLGATWRKKSYGILAVMFYDVTVHPTYPWVTAGGFQDNGCWVGLGGQTWYHLSGGDGGAVVFNPGDLTRIITTWQGWTGSGSRHALGVVQCDISNVDETPGLHPDAQYKSALPDLTTVRPGDAVTIKKFKSDNSDLTRGFDRQDTATFTGVMEHHPTTVNNFLVGRVNALYLNTDGTRFLKQNTAAFFGGGSNGPEVSAVAYAPSAPNTDRWMGTSQGQVFMTGNGGTTWFDVTPPALAGLAAANPPGTFLGQACTDVAIHPSNPNIVVVTVALFGGVPGGQIYITGDKGTTWNEISGRVAPVIAVAADQASPSAAMCVAFDPTVPAAGPHTLYVGTLAGVFVIRNAVAPTALAPAPPAPVWRTFNNNLPLTLVYDIVPVVVRNAANAVVRTALRCGTHGRGLWECDLAGTPDVQLYIRSTPISDGRFYSGAANLATDPRLVPAPPLRFDVAFDVRVAKPSFAELEGRIDGAEFDELLVNTVPVAGLKNQVFVQVHTNGSLENVVDVRVQLYFANAPGTPPAVPDLQAAFWNSFPADPPAGAWRKGPFEFISGLGAAQPVVARLVWVPPLDVGNQVALLAVCSHAQDNLATPPLPTLTMNPTNAASLVRTERRAALRVTAVDFSFPSVFVRDGVNDAGPAGSVAWGGRSPDIIVRPAEEPTPDVTFADLGDPRAGDVMIGNATNHIYVRVSNRMDLVLSADVELYTAPHDTVDQPGTWTQVGATVTVAAIAGKGSKLTPAFQIANPADPAPGAEYKVMMLIAVVYPTGSASPPRNSIADLETFWKFLIEGKDTTTDMGAACRAVRWRATP